MKIQLLILALIVVIVACVPVEECSGKECVDLAVSEEDPSFCERIGHELRTWCYTDVAAGLDDPGLCFEIADDSESAFCVADIASNRLDVELCREITHEHARDTCLYEIAAEVKKADLCGDIVQGPYGDDCAYDLASDFEDPVACQFVDYNITRQGKCFFFRAVGNNDSTICSMISENDWLMDWCVANVAIKLLDEEVCSTITNETVARTCRSVIKDNQE